MTPDRKLEEEHKEFLLSENTLKAWAGYTVKDRCALFHAEYPKKTIAPTSLETFYKKNGIKRKRVKMVKELSLKAQTEFPVNRQHIFD